MIEKKIHKMGNSYAVYLPIEWAKTITGKKVFLLTDPNGNLVLTPLKGGIVSKEKELHIDDYDFDLVHRIIMWAYRCGFDRFTLTFEKPITMKQVLEHKKKFEEQGLPLEIEDLSKTHFKFYFQQSLISPHTIFENSLNLALNIVRSKQEVEDKFMNVNFRDLQRNRHTMRRIMISALVNPAVLYDFSIDLKSCFDMDHILQYIGWACRIITENNVSNSDLENVKKTFELIPIFFSKKDFKLLLKCNNYIKNIDSPQIQQELRRVHRYLISSLIC